MPERFSFSLAVICGIAVLFGGVFSHWDASLTVVSTLGAMVTGLIVGRLLGGVSALQVAKAIDGPKPVIEPKPEIAPKPEIESKESDKF
ncbi:MAG: hypothetical protein V3V10_01935 [Planctomycetota bacterium]